MERMSHSLWPRSKRCSPPRKSRATGAALRSRLTEAWFRAHSGQRSASRRVTSWKLCSPNRAAEIGANIMTDILKIADRSFKSRLFIGTAGYPNQQVMLDAIAASGAEMATASIRRISLAGEEESLFDVLRGRVHFLPNTAGCQTAKDAVLTAELAREALGTNWIKVEVI